MWTVALNGKIKRPGFNFFGVVGTALNSRGAGGSGGGEGASHMKRSVMLIGKFELNH